MERVKRRCAGLRPMQIWVSDTRREGFHQPTGAQDAPELYLNSYGAAFSIWLNP